MSDTIYNFPDGKLHWDALTGTKYGDLQELTIDIPATLSGRLDVWAVPVCDAYPEGYFVTITNGQWYNANEPGCNSWEKHCLCKIKLSGVKSNPGTMDTDTSSGGGRTVAVEYWNPVLPDYNMNELLPDAVEVK